MTTSCIKVPRFILHALVAMIVCLTFLLAGCSTDYVRSLSDSEQYIGVDTGLTEVVALKAKELSLVHGITYQESLMTMWFASPVKCNGSATIDSGFKLDGQKVEMYRKTDNTSVVKSLWQTIWSGVQGGYELVRTGISAAAGAAP